VLDDGRLTDGQGRTVDFRNTVIIMTSNLGTELWMRETYPTREEIQQVLQRFFRPEFLNRIDEIVVFKQLTKEHMRAIVDLQIRRVAERLAGQRITLQVTERAKDWLAEVGYDPDFGARPLKRAIQRELLDPLSLKVLAGEIKEGDTVEVDLDEEGKALAFKVVARAEEARRIGATEMHIVGGLHHQRKYEWYVHLIRMLHQAHPRLHLKAWTAVEIHWFCHMTGYSYQRVLEEMIEAGLGSMPGGGAEIFHPEVRHQICEHKADAQCWLDIHRTAHRLGLRTTCTMLYGHIEKPCHRVDHLFRLRALQDETGGFLTFIPLAFHPENTGLAHLKKPSVLDDLRTMAISRLVLDNVPHVKAYWVMLGLGTAQAALSYGADDFDGTVRHERIYHDAGADRRVERQGTQWHLATQEPDSARAEHLATLAPAASYGG